MPAVKFSHADNIPKPFREVAGVDANRFRRARFSRVLGMLEELAGNGRPVKVLDIGPPPAYWSGLRDLWGHIPLNVTLVNLGIPEADDPPFAIRSGNACVMPEYADNSFDLIHSNSVIEHVGHWNEMRAMANEVRRLAPRHYLQTPNFGFPVEPHYRTLFFHWYPEAVRARMLMRKKRGFRGPHPTIDAAMRDLQSVNLLNAAQLAALFPDSTIERERFFGLAKSLIAVR